MSYPDGVQADDGRVFLIYDFDRRGAKEICLAIFSEADIEASKVTAEGSQLKMLINGDKR